MNEVSDLKEMLSYDPKTGVFRWRTRHGRGLAGQSGSVAGGLNLGGYWTIALRGRRYYAHRLAWLFTHDTWPTHQIDHIDRNRSNNRISNLRAATNAENARNSGPRKPLRFKGTYFHRQSGLWAATVMTAGRKRSLGYYKTEKLAHAAYAAAATIDHGEFARTE